MNIEKLVWVFVMGMVFGWGVLITFKEGLGLGLVFILIPILGISQTNNIFDVEFED